MNGEILNVLKTITQEEQRILSGENVIDKKLYMSNENDVIDSRKLLGEGKMIQVRAHTRFVYFPKHTHNYIEVIYMCSGQTHHVINGTDVILKSGELLFLSQNATQEIYAASEDDVAVNFIIQPEFFDYGLQMIGSEESLLRNFIIKCLKGDRESSGYLHFKVTDILPVQNLVENLIWTIMNKQSNKRRINQVTMGLLFLQLMNYMDKLDTNEEDSQQNLIIEVLSYIDGHYKDGKLNELADMMHYDIYWLSKEIKKRTGMTYTELVQTKRMNQAAYLLTNTSMTVIDIAMMVGYDNISYFHRIFQNKFKMTPRAYRIGQKK